ncbi:MAG: conserved exported protein of unknown function [Promethearchaeota archaeon]|nr:MAG: conserved exported protein of unknown function [Candidatus Lokiarchaeota archaeon]
MCKKIKKAKKSYILLSLLILSTFSFLLLPNDNGSPKLDVPLYTNNNITSSNGSGNDTLYLIVYFNSSTYDKNIEDSFESYGGSISLSWNDTFSSFSGFAGSISQNSYDANISVFQDENPTVLIENDENVEAQLNFASLQAAAVNETWASEGYKGDTNGSIALLDSGIDLSHIFLQNKVRENESYIEGELPHDFYGHGTFLASVIAGTGIKSYNSTEESQLFIERNFTHSEIFGFSIAPQNYSIKIATLNISDSNDYLFINSSWNLITEGIDGFWVELYYDGEVVNSSYNENQSTFYPINHTVSEEEFGIYDIRIKYHKQTNKDPVFSMKSYIFFLPEAYITGYNSFTGIANASKLINYKVLNNTGKGRVSNIISALEGVYSNKISLKIISVCLSVGTLGSDVSAITHVIDEVAESGIVVVIAAGNYGIRDSDALNSLGRNKNAIVVGSINDEDQLTFYSSMGKNIGEDIIKPDLLAPGGSKLFDHRDIISAAANSNASTVKSGTSISAAIVSAAINILIEARWNDWNTWKSLNTTKWSKILKAILLMTATETNLPREDNPDTEIDESEYSPYLYQQLINSTNRADLKDEHEGYGRINIDAAVDALTKQIGPNKTYEGHLASSASDPLAMHAFARTLNLTANRQYCFNLTDINFYSTFDLYLYSNITDEYGEPIILSSSRKSYGNFNYLYFTPKENETRPILVIKAINGESNFTLNITEVENIYEPQLRIPEVPYVNGPKNTTVLSLSELQGEEILNNITLDRYKFYIEYIDNDTSNVPPQQIYVYIKELSTNFTLTPLFQEEANYSEGVIFISSLIELPDNKTYNYRFYVKDGLRNASLPTNPGEFFQIQIELPSIIKQIEYSHYFNDGLDNWTLQGTGWNILYQNNSIDDRSRIYTSEWSTIYFGSHHNYPTNYTYQPSGADTVLNGSLTSPYLNLTGLSDTFIPIIKMGLRVSINQLDSIDLYINANGTGWQSTPLKSFSNIEEEWILEEVNLSEYRGNFVKFKLNASLDEEYDLVKYKGFMLDYISIENCTTNASPEIFFTPLEDVKVEQDLKFQKVQFSLEYYEQENNYPEHVYIEINNKNYSMINIYGDWNASSNITGDRGIYFLRSLNLDDMTNKSFRFHVLDPNFSYSTSYYNTDNQLITYTTPVLLDYNVFQGTLPIGFGFSNTLDNFYVTGIPMENERTSWLQGDNTWHRVYKLYHYYLYGGVGQGFSESFRGYGQDWNAQLITKPINVLSRDSVFLEFSYEIDLQNELSLSVEERDYCEISISNDLGESWKSLKKYYFDSEGLPRGNESIDISEYSSKPIMIKFSLHSNDYNGATPGFGWLLSDIYIGYDRSKNHNILDINSLYYQYLSINKGQEQTWFQGFDPMWIFYIILAIAIVIGITIITYYSIMYLSQTRERYLSKEKTKEPFLPKSLTKKETSSGTLRKMEELEATQSEKPLILHCKYCKAWYYTDQEYDLICPICKRDQIYVAYNCINCGKWYFEDTEKGDHYCDTCNIKLFKQNPQNIEELIHNKGKILQKYKRSEDQFSILDSDLD